LNRVYKWKPQWGVTTDFLLKGELLFWYTLVGQQCASLARNSAIVRILVRKRTNLKGLKFSQRRRSTRREATCRKRTNTPGNWSRQECRTHSQSSFSGGQITIFRINTCKSVSKQRTLSPFRMNTCEKNRGEGVPLASSITPSGIYRTNATPMHRECARWWRRASQLAPVPEL
jgi:hypothetical protein